MNRKIIRIILMSLLAVVIAAGVGMMAVYQIQNRETIAGDEDAARTAGLQTDTESRQPEAVPSAEEPPEVTAPSTEEPPEETAALTEEPPEETAALTEEPPEVTAPSPEEPPEETTPSTEKPPKETVPPTEKPPEETPRPAISNTAASYPSAPGTAVEKNASAVIDYSNAKDGYVMVKWTGEAVKVAVQVMGPSNPEKYTYYPRTDGNYDVLPLSDGNGTYQFVVCKNVSGTKYAQALSASITVRLDNSLAPFLRPNQYVNYSSGSQAVKKAQELVKDAKDNLSKVKVVYNWVVTNLSYDYDKAKTVKSGYLPDVDKVMREKKGICFDYAALMSSMLRSQGVPVKLVVGYTSTGEYHAWINVWSEESGWMDSVIYFDGKTWKLMDPTFASTGEQSQSIMEYIGNTANYKERFTY